MAGAAAQNIYKVVKILNQKIEEKIKEEEKRNQPVMTRVRRRAGYPGDDKSSTQGRVPW